jgi:hypothetical protein
LITSPRRRSSIDETIYIETLDHEHQEAEHSLFMVPARSKSAAITRLRMEKAYDKRLLHVTPFSDILKRRAYWKEERAYWKKEAEAGMAQQP